jgi:hypothetical protein
MTDPVKEDRSEIIEKEMALLRNKMLELETLFKQTHAPEASKLLLDAVQRLDHLEQNQKALEAPKNEPNTKNTDGRKSGGFSSFLD